MGEVRVHAVFTVKDVSKFLPEARKIVEATQVRLFFIDNWQINDNPDKVEPHTIFRLNVLVALRVEVALSVFF